jgi:hypothetical protein
VGESKNSGLEMLLNLVPVRTTAFQWDLSANASYNTSRVLVLGESGQQMITVGNGLFGGELRQQVGRPLGQLYGFGYLRDEQGNRVFGPRACPCARPTRSTSAAPCPCG